MPNYTGIPTNTYLNCCVHCGQLFSSRHNFRELCLRCTEKLNNKLAKDAEAKRAEQRRKVRPTRSASGMSIGEIVRESTKLHMSYGEYVRRYGG